MTEHRIFEEPPNLFTKAAEIKSLHYSKNLNTIRIFFLFSLQSFMDRTGSEISSLSFLSAIGILTSVFCLLFQNLPFLYQQIKLTKNSNEASLLICIVTFGQHVPVF